jgi:hypothetical protein
LRHGPALAFSFGLVHGFGFAGALAETLGGAPRMNAHFLLDLAAFNLGIEAFQLALVVALAPVLRAAVRHPWSVPATGAASFAVFAAGLGWFFTRILGT